MKTKACPINNVLKALAFYRAVMSEHFEALSRLEKKSLLSYESTNKLTQQIKSTDSFFKSISTSNNKTNENFEFIVFKENSAIYI